MRLSLINKVYCVHSFCFYVISNYVLRVQHLLSIFYLYIILLYLKHCRSTYNLLEGRDRDAYLVEQFLKAIALIVRDS